MQSTLICIVSCTFMSEKIFWHIVPCDNSSKKNLRIANSELGCYYLEEIISCQQRYWTAVPVPTPRRALLPFRDS